MKPSTELFKLIKSLTKSEKRFFKLSSSLQSGSKNYLTIFDYIEKHDVYNEASLKKKFIKEVFVKHLPSEKNHLYKLILKSLRAYHSDNSITSVLKQEIKNVEVLYNKALYKECNKFLLRSKKIAVLHEKFYFLFELISWEKLLLEEQLEDGTFTKDLDGLIDDELDVIDKLGNLAQYHVLYSKINYAFRSGGYCRTATDRAIVNEIAQHPLIIGKNTALSDRAATICYYTQGFCSLSNWNYSEAYDKFRKVKYILDKNLNIRKDLAKRYVKTISKMLACQIYMGNLPEANRLISEMEMLKNEPGFKKVNIQVEIFKEININKLKSYGRSGKFKEGLLVVEHILEEMPKYADKLHREQELSIYFHIATVYFGAGEYKNALQWINRILNENENVLRQDLYSYARLFDLLIHYELENYELMEYTIKSTQRYLNKKQRDFDVEKVVIKYMKKLIKYRSEDQRAKVYLDFKNSLEEVITADEHIILKYIDFPSWLKGKIENKTFAEAIQL